MRILVTGSTGRLGGALCRIGGEKGHGMVAVSRREADFTDLDRLVQRVKAERFDALINPAAITDLEACEGTPETAMRVNGEAPGALAALCRERGVVMVQISTDYVFSGTEPGRRGESEEPRPINSYGRSKLAGEREVLATDPNHLVARVSWLFGREKPAFVETILDRARQHETIEAIADKFSSPSWCDDTARTLFELLERGGGGAGGVFHVANRGEESWRSYAEEILARARACGVRLRAREVRPARLSEMSGFAAARPVHTALSVDRIEALLGRPQRRWQEALTEYFRSPGGPCERIA